jgi:hypothetical protein
VNAAIAIINAAVLGSPILIGTSWWLWARRDRTRLPRWRVTVLLVSLITASANGLLFYAWAIYAAIDPDSSASLLWKNPLGNYVGLPLIALTLAGAIAGGGASGGALAATAVMGCLLWLTPGFL